ncbi:MAG: sulfatase-like hydrolase/transferase, partial [Acidobacteriaceae bacterium]|nr:sulfatase-like hydrolase/transferase [Acidobacteriaceae bacterium]
MSDTAEERRNSRRAFLKSTAATTVGTLTGAARTDGQAVSGERRPNFVFFLGEGARWDEFGFAGNPLIHTPNFDRIARQGMVFRNAFVTNALCTPSRASILTGRYSHANGVLDNRATPIPENIPIVTDLLREAGYDVGLFGKVHVHDLGKRNWNCYFGIDAAGANFYHAEIPEGANGIVGPPKRYDGYFDD